MCSRQLITFSVTTDFNLKDNLILNMKAGTLIAHKIFLASGRETNLHARWDFIFFILNLILRKLIQNNLQMFTDIL